MKIAMISEHASPLATLGGVDSGGQNVYVAQLAQQLASQGHNVEVFTRKDNISQPEVVKLRDNLQVIHVSAGPATFIKKEELLPYMDDFSNFMASWFETYGKPDLIHANFWMSGVVASTLKSIFRIPFVITFHALGRIRRLFQGDADLFPEVRFEIEEHLMRDADRIIAECPQDRIDMVELYNADTNKIAMIPCGFDPQEFDPIPRMSARQRLKLPGHEKIILQLGRMVPRKGIDTVIKAFSKFLQKERHARLLIVGGNSSRPDPFLTPEIGRLQSIVQEEGIGHAVNFLGQVQRRFLKYYYSAADVFITTPWYEPFGITPLEAMACGTPVIGSDVGGIKYTVKHGVTGFLVPPKDEEALFFSMRKLYGNPGRHAFMSKEAVEYVKRFAWDKIAALMNNLYWDVHKLNAHAHSLSG